MQMIDLEAKVREADGTRRARRIRRAGNVPANVYGHGIKPVSIEVNLRILQKALHTRAGENVLLNLKLDGASLKETTCRVKDIQHNPVTDQIDHVDFTLISLTEKIQVKIPLVVRHADDAAGVKEGGVLNIIHHEIEVECLPTHIPEKIDIDVKDMKMGDLLHAKELKLPEGVVTTLDADEVVVALQAPEEEKTPEAEGEQATEPEVIEKGKKPAEGEEGEEAPKAEKKK